MARSSNYSAGVWKDESLVLQLVDLWNAGNSCSQIARALGHGISRNSVIGKVTRLGLNGRQTTSRMTHSVPKGPARPKLVPKEPPAPVIEEEPVILEDGSHVTIMTVTDRMCRWPIGDPTASDFHFCGRSSKFGAPYCEAHARKAYQPALTAASRKKGEAAEAAMSAFNDRAARRIGLG
jgi:GcrA cell cycle regulator